MSLKDFRTTPWKKSHRAYDDSAFNIRPAPEFSTSEVVVASIYRSCGFAAYPETEVPKAGREFDRLTGSPKARGDAAGKIATDTWHTVLHDILESPKQPNQSSKRFLSLCPMVPDVSLYSGSARLAGNSWNPGALVKKMIQLGADSNLAAETLWARMFAALSVSKDDDIWARWLDEEFSRRRKVSQDWKQGLLGDPLEFPERTRLKFPARRFVHDLDSIIQAKGSMTRRQWVSLLEGIVRLGAVSHVLWLCHVNDKLWRSAAAILGHGIYAPPTSEEGVRAQIVMGDFRSLSYGNAAMPVVRDLASAYLVARLGLNLLLWHLEEMGKPVNRLNSSSDLWKLLLQVTLHKEELRERGVIETFLDLRDDETRTINCKKGIGSNLVEFARHTLGQRQTANESLRGYDQGYFLRKKGGARNAPWVLSLGPVAVLAVVHCCLHGIKGPRSVQRLSQHLANYGIEVDTDDINASDLGRKLRMLGLVLDSPDAESGMLLVHPFASSNAGITA